MYKKIDKKIKNIIYKIINIFFLFYLIITINNYKIINRNINIIKNLNLNYNKKFIIISRKYSTDGLLAYYYMNIGCIHDYIFNRQIPIIDLSSHPNIFNGFNTKTTKNPWEEFFNQPFNYTLNNVKKNAKNIKYVECYLGKIGSPSSLVFYNKTSREYWHNIAKRYVPIKSEIIKEANYKFNLLFNNSINILGILIRGTDYIAKMPHGHAIQPSPKMVFKDIKKMDNKNKYDWFFITTEDDLIREKFIIKFGKKLKYIKSKTKINYDYKKKKLLAFNNNIKGNFEFMRTYLINISYISFFCFL